MGLKISEMWRTHKSKPSTKSTAGKTAYFACHMKKFKAKDVKGMQIHVERETQNSTNKDIERELSTLNYDLKRSEGDYSGFIENRLKDAYTGSKGIRKDATLMTGFIVTANKDFFDELSPEQEREYFQTAYDYLADKYGEENIVSAKVHKDEKTPHLHLYLVPLTKDGRLSAKELFDRDGLKAIQDDIPKALQQKGFKISRGLP